MTKRSDINVTMTFHPKEGTKCGYCGICSFAHRHKAGTLPKDFERIAERQSTKQKDTECNCIMSGYAQTTNCCPLHKAPKFMEDDLQKEYNKNTHSNKTNAYPKMNFIQEELKRFDEEFGYSPYYDINRGGFQDCSVECELDAKKVRDFIIASHTRLLERVEKELIGVDESIRGDKSSSPVYDALCRNQFRDRQRANLKEMGGKRL